MFDLMNAPGQAGSEQPGMDPERRARMAMALAGNSPMAPIVQAMAYRQQMANKPQMVSPGTAGWPSEVVSVPGTMLSNRKSTAPPDSTSAKSDLATSAEWLRV